VSVVDDLRRQLVEEKLLKLRKEWERMTAHLPPPYVRSEYGELCLDCGAMWEPRGSTACPACTSEASMPLRMLDLAPNAAALGAARKELE
jgi:hypothetical protein